MHITIPSSSCSGKESYTKFLFIPRGYTDNSYPQIKVRPHPPFLAKRSCNDYSSPKNTSQVGCSEVPQSASEIRLEVKTDSALLAPSDHLYKVIYSRSAQRGKRRMNFTSKRSLHNEEQIN